MARFFDDGSSQYLTYSTFSLTEPFTYACWFRADEAATWNTLISHGKSTAGTYHMLAARGDDASDRCLALTYDGVNQCYSYSTAGYAANTWHHACGVFIGTDTRYCYLDGRNKGATAGAPATLADADRLRLGVTADSTPSGYMSGAMAEAVIYNVALTDLDAWELWMGRPPWEIRPANLLGLWLPFGDWTDRDFSGRGHHMASGNSPTWKFFEPPETVRAWRSNPQYVGRRVVGREQPGGVWARPWGKAIFAPHTGGIAWGEQNPVFGETPVEWPTWSDGAGGTPTVDGDPDWGKLYLACTEEGRSQVYDLGNANPRWYTLTENRYGAGSGTATLQIRGDTDPFGQDDGEPPNWENYAAPVLRSWRYVQSRETH